MVSTSTTAGWGLTSVPLPLSLIISRCGAPPKACFSPSRMAAYSPGSILWTLAGMRCRRQVYHTARSTAVTASASVQPLQQLQEVWRIVSFRRWAGGRAWPICVTYTFRGSSWRATRPFWLYEVVLLCCRPLLVGFFGGPEGWVFYFCVVLFFGLCFFFKIHLVCLSVCFLRSKFCFVLFPFVVVVSWGGSLRPLLQPSFPPYTTPWILEGGGVGPHHFRRSIPDGNRWYGVDRQWCGSLVPRPPREKIGIFSRGAWERG